MATYCTISHNIDGLLPDEEDEIKVEGRVIFSPVLTTGDAYVVDTSTGPTTVVAAKVTANIIDGRLVHDGEPGVRLFAGGPNSNPEIVRYQAQFRDLKVNGQVAKLRDIIFDAIPDGVINLANAQPPAGAPPVGIILRGEKGDAFAYEDFTPEQLEALRGPQGPVGDITPAAQQALSDMEDLATQTGNDAYTAEQAAAQTVQDRTHVDQVKVHVDDTSAATILAAELVDSKLDRAETVAVQMATFNITFTEDPPGSGLFAVPSHGLTPDPANPGFFLIGA